MKQVNPKFTWREWMIVPAYEEAEEGNYNKNKRIKFAETIIPTSIPENPEHVDDLKEISTFPKKKPFKPF